MSNPESLSEQRIAELKASIARSWIEDTAWSDRTQDRDYDSTPDFVKLTAMFGRLVESGAFTRVVEIGCGDAKYLAYLKARTRARIADWIATDLDGPRLERARQRVPEVRVEAADLLQCLERYNRVGTVFVAANVLGNIAPDDLAAFFRGLNVTNTALVLLAGGLSLESTARFQLRANGIAFDHNFFALVRDSALVCREYEVGSDGAVVGYWIAASVPGPAVV